MAWDPRSGRATIWIILYKSFSAQTVSWEDVKNVETKTTLVKLYTQLCFSLITVKFRSGHCTRSSNLCCSNFPIMQLVVFWFIFFSQGQSWMLPFILAVDTSWFRCQVRELLVSTGRAAACWKTQRDTRINRLEQVPVNPQPRACLHIAPSGKPIPNTK